MGLYVSPPFVNVSGDHYSGMAVDLWTDLAQREGLTFEYRILPTLRALTNAVASGDIDVAVTNLTITKDRATRLDFSQPWFDGGLRIMVDDGGSTGFASLWSGLRVAGHLWGFALIGIIIAVATLALTLFDRRFDPGFPTRWRDGLADSFYSVVSAATKGNLPARKNLFGWGGRVWQALWLVCGIGVIAYVTSSITSVMTTLSLTSDIHNLGDLAGRPIGVFSGSVAESHVRELGLTGRPFADVDEAVAALLDGRVAAIVGDAPVLEYFAHRNPDAGVSVVGPIFEPDKYGFGFAPSSPLVRPVTLGILGAKEDGLIESLRLQYFGGAL